jgi:acetyl esterase/lipase
MDLTHSMPSFKAQHSLDYLPDKSADPAYISPDRSHYFVPHNSLLQHPLVSPLFASDSNAPPLPPTLIQIGDAEKLRDENLAFFVRSFPASEIRLELYEDMVHVFQLLAPVDSFCQRGIDRIGVWTEAVANGESPGRDCLWVRRKDRVKDATRLSDPPTILSSLLQPSLSNE